jgi:hypothetical protein
MADLVLGLIKPVQYSLKTFYGYNLDLIGQYFIVSFIMKNRYGPADRWIPLFMNPLAGIFYDVPELQAMTPTGAPAITYLIEEAQRLDKICQQFNSPLGATQ